MKTPILFVVVFSALLLFSCSKKETTSNNNQNQTQQTQNNSSNQSSTNQSASGTQTGSNNNITMLEFDKKNIPASVKYKGNIVAGSRWKDKDGENLLIVTETDPQSGMKDDEEVSNKEIFAYCYLIENGNAALLWNINDFVKDCAFDLTAELIPNSITVTDLNNNGIAENTFLYKLSCKSDVSPDDFKLMMHEGNTKYAIRGTTQVSYEVDGKPVYYGGEGTPDASFNSAPQGFLQYAKAQWEKFKTQKF